MKEGTSLTDLTVITKSTDVVSAPPLPVPPLSFRVIVTVAVPNSLSAGAKLSVPLLPTIVKLGEVLNKLAFVVAFIVTIGVSSVCPVLSSAPPPTPIPVAKRAFVYAPESSLTVIVVSGMVMVGASLTTLTEIMNV